jgi:putative tricarboxylic transport membrane protein
VSAPIEEYALGAGVVALGVFTLVDAQTIVVPGSANTIGPRAFPTLVGALLVLAGAAVVVATARGRLGEAEGGEDVDPTHARTDWWTVGKLVVCFAAMAVLVDWIGWPLATALVFGGVAWSLGARPWWKPLLIGLALGVSIQLVFATGLGLSLPAGPFGGVPFLHG